VITHTPQKIAGLSGLFGTWVLCPLWLIRGLSFVMGCIPDAMAMIILLVAIVSR
jgi:hypothetical protein